MVPRRGEPRGERMKVMISVDVEGTAGIASWEEALKEGRDHAPHRAIMTAEAVAACEGAAAGGASEIWVRDAHESARNIDPGALPSGVRLVRGWSGHPLKMLQELDASFDAVAMVGWHGPAGAGGNPLSHTMTEGFAAIALNGEPMSEFVLHAHLAAREGVPVVFLSGDAEICASARRTNPAIRTAAAFEGRGASVVARTPGDHRAAIREGLAEALRVPPGEHALPRAERYELRATYHDHTRAHAASFYPGARLADPTTVTLEAPDAFEIARAMGFIR